MGIQKPKKPTAHEIAQIAVGPIACEICGTLSPTVATHSIIMVYAMPGQDSSELPFVKGHPPYQCESEQHFACCYEHAALAAITCLLHHMNDARHEGASDIQDINLSMVHQAMLKFK